MKKRIFGLGLLVVAFMHSVALANDYCYQGDCCLSPCETRCERGYEGGYIGGNLGVITQIALFNEEFLNTTTGREFVNTNFTIGGQLGYDWTCSCGLLGLVFDWDWSNIDHTYTALDGDKFKLDLDWYLTIRGRAGVTVCDWLFYFTVGAASAHFETTWDSIYHKDQTRWGWSGGLGIERLLGCNWSLGADLLFMHFSHERKKFLTGTTSERALETNHSLWVGRMILNYHFGDLFCCR